jgi:DNA-binding NarL/FixJ family response regulator
LATGRNPADPAASSVGESRRDGAAHASATPLRVVIADDSLIAREGLVRVLGRVPGVEVVAACSDLPGVRDAVTRLGPDVVLTDIPMPPTRTDEGIRLAEELRSTAPQVAVLVVSQHAEPAYALALLDGGAQRRGYLLKERVRDERDLDRALREVVDGGSLVDPFVVGGLLDHWANGDGSPLSRLTSRDTEILALVAEGRSNSAIAEALDIGKRAVERHIAAIFEQLELTDVHSVDRRVKAALLYLDGKRR